jgi:hypothetical protein
MKRKRIMHILNQLTRRKHQVRCCAGLKFVKCVIM